MAWKDFKQRGQQQLHGNLGTGRHCFCVLGPQGWRKLQLFPAKCFLVLLSGGWLCYVSLNPFWCFIYRSVHLRQTACVLIPAKQKPECLRKSPKKLCTPHFPCEAVWRVPLPWTSFCRALPVPVTHLAGHGGGGSGGVQCSKIKAASQRG